MISGPRSFRTSKINMSTSTGPVNQAGPKIVVAELQSLAAHGTYRM